MRYKIPSEDDRFFRTPARYRPELDLRLHSEPVGLSEQQMAINTGPTRWFDWVYGSVLDDVQRQGMSVSRLNEALDSGRDMTLRTAFFPVGELTRDLLTYSTIASWSIGRAAFVGTVGTLDGQMIVSGGPPDQIPSAIIYGRSGDWWFPQAGQFNQSNGKPKTVAIPDPFDFDEGQTYPETRMPEVLRAAHALGELADVARLRIDDHTMVRHGRVAFLG